jgi:hypothetical protein
MITGPAIKADVSFRKAAPQLSYLQKLTWLQENLLKINPQKAYLLNHHQDSVAVAAIQDEMGIEASFYHHGDHHLCLGIYLPHIEHVDLHPMGYHYCRNVLGIKNTYVPLVVEDQGPRPVEWPFMAEGGLTTCTAARSNKVDIPYFVKDSTAIENNQWPAFAYWEASSVDLIKDSSRPETFRYYTGPPHLYSLGA